MEGSERAADATGEKSRFDADSGHRGLWEPATSLHEEGFGLYLAQRYRPGKTPVVFIHGAGGSPQDFRYLIGNLDRRYQPWFFQCPSGMRLEAAARGLNAVVKEAQARYGFEDLIIVARSMGGLMARRFVMMNTLDDGGGFIEKFVTISTPWNGHKMAQQGIDHAPSAIPSWYDIRPGSPFIEGIFRRKLHVPYFLIYSHKSKPSFFLPAENDGAFSVESQLDERARSEARSIQGFPYDHFGVLSEEEVLRTLESYLEAD